jgi:hypothetical protein
MTPEKAVAQGSWSVNGPVRAILISCPIAAWLVFTQFPPSAATFVLGSALALGTFTLSWIAWSFLVVRWRLWAYERVDDIETLKSLAVEAGIIWPDGNLFERTEFRTAAARQRLRELEASKIK